MYVPTTWYYIVLHKNTRKYKLSNHALLLCHSTPDSLRTNYRAEHAPLTGNRDQRKPHQRQMFPTITGCNLDSNSTLSVSTCVNQSSCQNQHNIYVYFALSSTYRELRDLRDYQSERTSQEGIAWFTNNLRSKWQYAWQYG